MTTGKVTSIGSKPARHFTIQPDSPPGAPPVEFNVGIDADDYATALAAYTKGGTADASGTAPACTGVTAR